MTRASLLLAGCIAVTACFDDSYQEVTRPAGPTNTPDPVSPSPKPPAATYVLFGTVRDIEGVPLAGATVAIVTEPYAGREVTSNANGYFSFTGVAGMLTVRVYKEGYDRYLRTLIVDGDLAIEVKLPRVEQADTLRLGQTIQATVEPHAPPCDPIRWDARAPCRTFLFTPRTSGLLVVTVTWNGGPELDATLVLANGEYVATSTDAPGDEVSLAAAIEAGKTYVLRVNAYYAGQVFLLKAEFQGADGP